MSGTRSVAGYTAAFAALLALTALTTGVAFIDLGELNAVIAVAIAATKALIVALVFMHMRRETLVPVFSLAGLVWLAILLGLTFADFASRG